MQGYMNVTKNKRLSYCFDAITISQIGKIKSTIKFNFKHNNVIMIVCNRPLHSNYDCIGDIRIINGSVRPKWPKH